MEHLAQISIFLFLKQLNQIISATIKNLEMIDFVYIHLYLTYPIHTPRHREDTYN